MPVSEQYFSVTGFAFPVVEGGGGSCDYPSSDDVRDGVSYASGLLEGVMEVPSVANVLAGVRYGADGTELTGILSASGD